jgi:hypothetical protein
MSPATAGPRERRIGRSKLAFVARSCLSSHQVRETPESQVLGAAGDREYGFHTSHESAIRRTKFFSSQVG